MSGFIRLLGDDNRYPKHKVLTFIATSAICIVQPIWAVKDDNGMFWRCRDDHNGAEIVSYGLVDIHGNEYICTKDEAQKFGIEIGGPKPEMGFEIREDGGKTASGES